jgi:hypothetical protein
MGKVFRMGKWVVSAKNRHNLKYDFFFVSFDGVIYDNFISRKFTTFKAESRFPATNYIRVI